MSYIVAWFVTLVIIFAVPMVVYGLFAKYLALPEPDKKAAFFVSVLVQKVGTALGFV